MQLVVASSPESLGTEVIRRIAIISRDSVEKRGVFTVAVSGGSMPKILRELSNAEGTDWAKCRIFFADERCVPLDHSDSNFKAWAELLGAAGVAPGNIVTVDTQLPPKQAAVGYEAKLKETFGAEQLPCFDVCLLGVGPDGHTCSLFPSHPLLDERTKWVAHIVDSPKPPPERVTLTYPVLNNSRNVIFIGTGEGKASLLPQLFRREEGEGDGSLQPAGVTSPFPAARVALGENMNLIWCIDTAAASGCPSEIISLATKC